MESHDFQQVLDDSFSQYSFLSPSCPPRSGHHKDVKGTKIQHICGIFVPLTPLVLWT